MLKGFEKFVKLWSNFFNWVAIIALIAMISVVTVDIIGAKIFGSPLPGAVELACFLGVAIAAFSAARTYDQGRHIRVDFGLMILPAKVRRVLLCIASLLSMTLFALLIWRTFLYGRDIQQASEVSLTLNLPYTPFVYGVALACIPLFLLLLVNFIQTLIKVKKG